MLPKLLWKSHRLSHHGTTSRQHTATARIDEVWDKEKRAFSPGELEANGHLFAAAPKLYEALEACIELLQELPTINGFGGLAVLSMPKMCATKPSAILRKTKPRNQSLTHRVLYAYLQRPPLPRDAAVLPRH